MIINILQWIMAVIAVEAIVEIIVDSELFLFWRAFLSKRKMFVGRYLAKLFTCGYCFSVWVAVVVAWCLPGVISGYWLFDVILKTFVLHRLSNLTHELFVRWLDRYPFSMVFNHVRGEVEKDNIIEVEEND